MAPRREFNEETGKDGRKKEGACYISCENGAYRVAQGTGDEEIISKDWHEITKIR